MVAKDAMFLSLLFVAKVSEWIDVICIVENLLHSFDGFCCDTWRIGFSSLRFGIPLRKCHVDYKKIRLSLIHNQKFLHLCLKIESTSLKFQFFCSVFFGKNGFNFCNFAFAIVTHTEKIQSHIDSKTLIFSNSRYE